MKKQNKVSTKKSSKELTKQKEWRPTPAMIVWIDTAVRLMTDNITEIEQESKITAQSWYNWIKKDEFLAWYRAEWDKRLSSQSWKLDAIGMKQAKRDHRYWESMQKRVGNLNEDKGIKMQFNTFIKNEKDEFGI